MLNGLKPLLIVNLKSPTLTNLFSGIPLLGSVIADAGIPFVIPLNENNIAGPNTAVLIDSETRSIDIDTRVEPSATVDQTTDELPVPIVTQRAVDTQVTISLISTRSSIVLNVLIAIMEALVPRLASAAYSIHYLNGPTAIFGAKLARFNTSVNYNDNRLIVEITLSTASKDSPTPKSSTSELAKSTGTIPL